MNRKSVPALVIAVLLANPALGGFVIFDNKADFEAFNKGQGKRLKGIETFEESNLGVGGGAELKDPLQGNVRNVDPATGLGFPKGLAQKNLIIQSNALGVGAPEVVPGSGLFALGPDFIVPGIPNSVVVGPFVLPDSLDLIFTEPNHTGIGLDVFDVIFGGDPDAFVQVTVFNKSNEIIVSHNVPDELDKVFFGIWSDETIGRVNIAAFNPQVPSPDGLEFVDNIQMWVPVPGTQALLCFAGLMGTGRRRRRRRP